jgi:hypothetical protein
VQFSDRNTILVIGEGVFEEKEFTQRGLRIQRCSLEAAPTFFNQSRFLLVADGPGRYSLLPKCYHEAFKPSFEYGLKAAVLAFNDSDALQFAATKKLQLNTLPFTIFRMADIWQAAQAAAEHNPGPSAGTVSIEPEKIVLTSLQQLLLRRAFRDCSQIYLEGMEGGVETAGAFRLHASFKGSFVGPRPLPFFVKVGKTSTITREIDNYLAFGLPFIPFHLRPQIAEDRCIKTADQSLLVGTFVDDAIELRESLRTGQGRGILISLFETTLRGFRAQPLAAAERPTPDVLKAFVEDRVGINRLRKDFSHRIEEAKSTMGLTLEPEEILRLVTNAAATRSILQGPYHADLHSGNVMVRFADAILIDFSKTNYRGPLTADPATLEVSLVFGTDKHDLGDNDNTADIFEEWQRFADEIYASGSSLRPPALFESKPGPNSWLRRSVRELRHVLMGCETEELDAKIVLCAYLMRHARLGQEKLPDKAAFQELAEKRHTYALVIAERLARSFATLTEPEGP